MRRVISVRLDDQVRSTLEEVAGQRGISLSAYLLELAVGEARRIRRGRIRAQSDAVAAYVASCPEARAFYEEWG
ncbi:hypothetical protein [Arenibaculum sp.]|jgi:predicted transcriptional regulator|uniref:hypothetical protein n=1 Tax=Arenibaculum sp. TaxID=2865862 RepID=UPI002E0F465A|nr:hypothetical protein [Arenibaculum sp.]